MGMHYTLLQFLLLLSAAFLLIMLAQKLKVSYPVFLVLAGLAVSYIPGMPILMVEPDLVFLIFLPPLLYEAAWYTSWNDFWKRKRPISLLAFGLVFFTSTVIAFFANAVIPGFTLAMGFLLGGIISPPDAAAASTILKHIKIPKRVLTILQGESLVNDASGLILFRFALAAVLTGQFSFHRASLEFILVVLGGLAVGLGIAYVMYLIHRFLPTTSNIDAAFTLVTPYFMYLVAEQFHFSGVIAVVSGGLMLSYRSQIVFSDGHRRLQGLNVWNTLILVLNGFIFIMIGLELPGITAALEGFSITEAWFYGLLISLLVIFTRIAWVYPATFIPRFLFKSIRNAEANPGLKSPFVIAWAGMRGVVSLATALSLPLLTADGEPFPHRSLIIFITFVVILTTLVFQGLTLPWIVSALKLKEIDPESPFPLQEAAVKLRLMKTALKTLNSSKTETSNNALLAELKKELENNIHSISGKQYAKILDNETAEIKQYNHVMQNIYKAQHKELYLLRKENFYSDEVIRKLENHLDLAESKTTGQWE